jgi:carbon monoxide dehydrogenase subunit G
MVIEGRFTLKAPIDKVFDLLIQPKTIMMCVPGATSVNVIDDTHFEGVIKQRMGIISTSMKLVMKRTKAEKPTYVEFEGEGEDMLGHIVQKTGLSLKETGPGEVEFSYKMDVTITGKLAMFGDKFMNEVAKDTQKTFTANLKRKLKTAV